MQELFYDKYIKLMADVQKNADETIFKWSRTNMNNSTLLKSKKILLTGTVGFIGYHLAIEIGARY